MLEKLLVKNSSKKIERLREEKADLQRKHEKTIKNERKTSADLQVKLHMKHNTQLNNKQKIIQDLCNQWDKKVDTERITSTMLAKENNKLRKAAAAATTARAGNKRGLETIAEMEHKIMYKLI